MATPELTHDLTPELMPRFLWQNLRRDWLVFDREVSAAEVADDWFNLVVQRRCQLERETISISNREHLRPRVLIAETDPAHFLAGFWAALLAGWDIALANPRWGAQEWTTTHHLIQPNLVWAASISPQIVQINKNYSSGSDAPSCFDKLDYDKLDYKNLDRKKSDQRLILIPTGGSSGQVKFVCHCWHSLVASAVGFGDYFGASKAINAYCVLPLYHVSGLMQAIRTLVSGGQLCLANFKELCQLPASFIPQLPRASSTFISLVPTQLERLLRAGKAEWLCQFEGVLLGGAPPWAELLRKAAAANIPVCLSYGMTEKIGRAHV